jgi:gamma-glutamyltranspeptidase/glutathione hydrolase
MDMRGRSTVFAPNGAVATSQPLATAAALAVLERGGNAVDAAVTAAAVLGLVEPHMTGIGGDMFALVWWAADRELHGLNASGRSGSMVTLERLVERGSSRVPSRGAESVTVPGALAGWEALLSRFGSVSLADALQPAIGLAGEGFPVSPIIAGQWANAENLWTGDGMHDGTLREAFSATYLPSGSKAPRAGEWFRNQDLASSYSAIARDGIGVLYGGALGHRVVDHLQALGGFVTLDDLRQHTVSWVEPMSATFGNYRLYELPPNGQGVAALEMLEILEGFDLRSMGHNSAAYLHHLIEAKKLAYADLEFVVGDPDHMTVSADQLLQDDFITERRALIDPARAADQPDPAAAVTTSETIYLTVTDRHGNMVSFINSIYSEFGSGVVVPGTGFALQNRGAGFTMERDRANTVGPRKLPFHTIIPAFATRIGPVGSETPWLSFGVMGGSMQPQGHVQMLLNLVVFGMDLQEAVDASRFRHLSGRRVAIEPGVATDALRVLQSMGHELVDPAGVAFGGAQAIMRLDRGWAAASDPRKDGMAAGH